MIETYKIVCDLYDIKVAPISTQTGMHVRVCPVFVTGWTRLKGRITEAELPKAVSRVGFVGRGSKPPPHQSCSHWGQDPMPPHLAYAPACM